jgi:hypothetical protein
LVKKVPGSKPREYIYKWDSEVVPNKQMAERTQSEVTQYSSQAANKRKINNPLIEKGNMTSIEFSIKLLTAALALKCKEIRNESEIELPKLLQKYTLEDSIIDLLVINGHLGKEIIDNNNIFHWKTKDISNFEIEEIAKQYKNINHLYGLKPDITEKVPVKLVNKEEYVVSKLKEVQKKSYKEIATYLEMDSREVKQLHLDYLCKEL